MQTETFERMKTHPLYKNSAVPFINNLILSGIPLGAINTNDWNSNYMPRVYVTKGTQTRKAHVNQLGAGSAKRLVKFYNT